MSVQVRRRREAASFLASFVGAQGELLVDTTNNRVQVHDGTTPGGWPAAAVGDLAGRNALINGTFAINQRGYTSGVALVAGTYAHDRWKAGAGGGTYSFAQVVPDTVVTITAGTLVQAVDAPNVTATSWWLTWTGTATARVWQGTASGSYAAGTSRSVGGVTVNALLVTGLALGTVTGVEFAAGTLGLVQFEAALSGAGPTRFERRHGEISLCLRYFCKIGGGQPYLTFAFGSAGSSTFVALVLYGLLVPMRAAPTLTSTGSFVIASPTSQINVQSVNLNQSDGKIAAIYVIVSGGANGFYFLQANNDATASISLSAEI